jgi:hypothetical protein
VGAAVALAGAILALVIRPATAPPKPTQPSNPDTAWISRTHSSPSGWKHPQAAFLQAVLWFLLPFTLSSPWPPGSPSMAHSS